MKFDYIKIYNKISETLKTLYADDKEMDERRIKDICFHMTDWYEDLEELADFYANPEKYSAEETDELLIKFLIHVPNHVAAAKKLFMNDAVADIFGVGAVEILPKEKTK